MGKGVYGAKAPQIGGEDRVLDSISSSTSNYRFENLLSEGKALRPIWDTVLYGDECLVVAPTLGAIIPFWHLVIPRRPALNLKQAFALDPSMTIGAMLDIFEQKFTARNLLWFEHGASSLGSQVGCGTDYAHLHVVINPPFSFTDFKNEVTRSTGEWIGTKPESVYREIQPSKDYYVFGDRDIAFSYSGAQVQAPQFFRRAIADLTSNSESWDYRDHPFEENVRLTIDAWRSLK